MLFYLFRFIFRKPILISFSFFEKLKPTEERNEDGPNSRNLNKTAEELMSKKELSNKISQKKSNLAPIIKELKALREEIDVSQFSRSKYLSLG